jgi:hypothetical protein
MAATFQFSQSTGAGESKADIGDGSGGNYFNFMSEDQKGTPADYTNHPITAGNDSFEVYIQGHWTGTFSSISNIKYWLSTKSLTGYGSTASLKGSVVAVGAYAAPTATPNADTAFPEVEGSALAPTYASNYCGYLRHQLHTSVAGATPGDGGTNTFTMKYDES